MNRAQKITVGICAAVFVGLAGMTVAPLLAVPTADPEAVPTADPDLVVAPKPTAVASATPTTAPIPHAPLDDYSYVSIICDQRPPGTDLGEMWSSGAQGTVEDRNADGLATLYTVGRGDVYTSVVERFCLDAREFDRLNGITDGQLYYGDVVAFHEEAAGRAQRADRIPSDSGPVYYTHQDCTGPIARVDIYSIEGDPEGEMRVGMTGTPRDTREGKYASGNVEIVDGQPVYYFVEAGDTWRGIGDRFCTDSLMLSMYNERAGLVGDPLHPGDVVEITPQRKTVPDMEPSA
ncbi:hypothetical protein Q9S71_01720 [Microbacterium sp. KSW4-11]|uniref:LysM domain-containing protein n=1 Tax=Microbacterium gawkjiense TaxID=3067309 RepID=A0ABU3G6V2_9MICO|nr:hypothetical protein [Microbacterium sp. KSW4-11]MDT3315529.1 hypothetical protein [Microbacterium sp. KSW4-11]